MEDVLRASLAPLFDVCHKPVALEHLFIVSDVEDAPNTFDGMYQNVPVIFAELLVLGRLRAQSRALRALEERLAPRTLSSADLFKTVIEQQFELQRAIQSQLEQSLARGRPGRQAIELELARCEAEQARLWQSRTVSADLGLQERRIGE
ncbi:MAG: hypothetical protein HC822_15330 [Oscillochloris sp.]|nr:hypothetical protein [Oscillochloris sp.]